MTLVHVVVPGDIDDPLRPSGGNVYDRRVCAGLVQLGWTVQEEAVEGAWPDASPTSRARLSEVVTSVPDGSVVLVDGLIACAASDALLPHVGRIRLVVLVHMPFGEGGPAAERASTRAREGAVLSAADRVVVTSRWTQRWLVDHYALRVDRVHVVEPGTDPAPVAPGTAAGTELLCVAAVIAGKGHDVLLDALAQVKDLEWHCVLVGSLTRDPAYVELLGKQADVLGLAERVTFAGPLAGAGLEGAYDAADLLVLASRAETYGMVLVEALARGIPVVASDVGGVAEAVRGPAESLPGILVPSEDPAALALALRRWLDDPPERAKLRALARERRTTIVDWSVTSAGISAVLEGIAA